MKLKELKDKELIELFESKNAFGSSEYMEFCHEFYKRFKMLLVGYEILKKKYNSIGQFGE